jgi:hypothetical protein
MQSKVDLLTKIRWALATMILGLFLSGLTALPIEWGLQLLVTKLLGIPGSASAANYHGLVAWLVTVRNGIVAMYTQYPWIAYGTDWLAFAHFVLALLFIGPLREPVRNIWVINFGILACLLVFPLALICGPIRCIPFAWRLVDCSFGVFGLIPLVLARHWTLELEKMQQCPESNF